MSVRSRLFSESEVETRSNDSPSLLLTGDTKLEAYFVFVKSKSTAASIADFPTVTD